MLILSFGSTRLSQTVSQRLGFGATVAVFLLVMGLLLQVVESRETKAASESGDDQEFAFVWPQPETPKPGEQSSGSTVQQRGWEPIVGSALDSQEYTFASIDSAASDRGTAASKPARIGPLALNSTSSAASNATMRGFGGGGPGLQPNAATEAKPIQVPESASSALLMSLSLLAVLGLNLVFKRQFARTSRFR